MKRIQTAYGFYRKQKKKMNIVDPILQYGIEERKTKKTLDAQCKSK